MNNSTHSKILKWMCMSAKKKDTKHNKTATTQVQCNFCIGRRVFFLPYMYDITAPICSAVIRDISMNINECTIRVGKYWEKGTGYSFSNYYDYAYHSAERSREKAIYDIEYPTPRDSFSFNDKDLFHSYNDCAQHVADLSENMHTLLDEKVKYILGKGKAETNFIVGTKDDE